MRDVVNLAQNSFAIALRPIPLDLAWRRITQTALFGMEMNSNAMGRTRLNDRSARERASAEHAGVPQSPTHDPTSARDGERPGLTMKTILCRLPRGFILTTQSEP
jgi:hypothetical protein